MPLEEVRPLLVVLVPVVVLPVELLVVVVEVLLQLSL